MPSTPTILAARARVSAFVELTKPRLVALVVVTAAAGFALGGGEGGAVLAALLVGTGLLAGGAAAANEWMEAAHDARMLRTRDRPIPSGRVRPGAALAFAAVAGGAGLSVLAAGAGPLPAGLGALCFAVYVAAYTPLKRVTTLCTPVGAVVGAIPPMMGFAAASGEIGPAAVVLAALLFTWQIPHFLAIAWLCREDYERGGFAMLPVGDTDGRRTFPMVLLYSGALLPVSLAAVPAGSGGPLYAAGALLLGGGFLWLAVKLVREGSRAAARRLFFASLAYLPLLLALLVFDPTARILR
ncbi:MAG: heme o synthase [Planctomycetes bacterium]|nr:heme o synthase [Planctomycetota bacterium]